jgi:hypothetical protein
VLTIEQLRVLFQGVLFYIQKADDKHIPDTHAKLMALENKTPDKTNKTENKPELGELREAQLDD